MKGGILSLCFLTCSDVNQQSHTCWEGVVGEGQLLAVGTGEGGHHLITCSRVAKTFMYTCLQTKLDFIGVKSALQSDILLGVMSNETVKLSETFITHPFRRPHRKAMSKSSKTLKTYELSRI